MRRRLGALLLAAVTAAAGGLLTTARPAAAAPPADHVLFWNDVLLRTYRQAGGPPTTLSRAGAMMHGAIYDAVTSFTCEENERRGLGCDSEPYLVRVDIPNNVNLFHVTMIDYAAVAVLRAVFPGRDFDADLTAAQEGRTPSPGQTESIRVGNAAAQAMLNARAGDGSADNTPHTPGTNPGDWRPTGSSDAVGGELGPGQAVRADLGLAGPSAAAGRLSQFDADNGMATGTRVADHVAANYLVAAPPYDVFGPFATEQACQAEGDRLVATPDYYEYYCDGFIGEFFLHVR